MKQNIHYFKHQEIDKIKWDQCIASSDNGLIFGYSWFLDSVFSNWDALILNDYEAIFPLPIKVKFGMKYMLNPIFALQLGIFGTFENEQELFQKFIANIPSSVRLIDYNFNYSNKLTTDKTYQLFEKKCQFVDLNSCYEEIKKDYSTNLKRNLSKAKKNKLILKYSNNFSNVVSIFRENRGNSLNELKDENYKQLESLLQKLISNKSGFILECWIENELLASAAFSNTNNRILYIKGGTSAKGRELNAMHLIMNHVIEENSSKNIIFDFGGSSIEQVSKFNYQFGAKDYYYTRFYKNNLPFLINLFKK